MTLAQPTSPIRAKGRADWRVWVTGFVLAVAALISGFAWSFSSPAGSSPDDDFHLASIWCPVPLESSGCTVVRDDAGEITAAEVPVAVTAAACFAFQSDASGECTENLSETELVPTERLNNGDYPGFYYQVMNLFVGEDVQGSVLAMRLFNSALAVVVLGAGLAIATRRSRLILAVAVLASVVPLGLFVIGSVNPSTWAFTGVVGAFIAMFVLFQAEERWRKIASAVLLVVSGTIAAVARSDAGAYLIILAIAMVILYGDRLRTRWRSALLLLVPVALGVWSFFSATQAASVLSGAWASNAGRTPFGVLLNNVLEIPGLIVGMFGVNWGLGWLDTRLPAIVGFGSLLVAGGVFMIGLGKSNVRKILALGLIAAALLLIPLYAMQQNRFFVGEGIQPRYILPLFPAFLGIALTGGVATKTVSLSRLQLFVIGLFLSVAQFIGLYENIRRYVTGQDVKSLLLDQGVEWWWSVGPSPQTVWLVGSLAFAVLAFAPFALTWKRKSADAAREAAIAEPTGSTDVSAASAPVPVAVPAGPVAAGAAAPSEAEPGTATAAPAVEHPAIEPGVEHPAIEPAPQSRGEITGPASR